MVLFDKLSFFEIRVGPNEHVVHCTNRDNSLQDLYTINLSTIVQLWQNQEGIWRESLKKIGRHIPFVQPFVHLYYLKELMNAKATIDRCVAFYKEFM